MEKLQIPHVVIKNELKKNTNKSSDDSSYFPFFGGKKEQKPQIEETPFQDDLGLVSPGTRNISINHQFKYYNYTEINLLNRNPEYRFEQSGGQTAAQENDYEERQKYIDKREKVRPGL